MAQTLDIIHKFLTDICLKLRCQLIHRARKHKVLPYHQTHLITQIKEPVFRIISAAPYTNCIKVRSLTLKKQLPCTLSGSSLKQIILRNIIRTHGKYRMTIDLMSKALTPLILLNMHGKRTKSDLPAPGIQHLVSCLQRYSHLI